MPSPASFAEAFRFWVTLGFISFGGPAGQIAIMHRELVERRRWVDEERFLHALNYCMLLPGPEAQQLATYIGWLLHGTRGGLVAGVFFVLPSIFILLALSWLYAAWGSVTAVTGVLAGFKPVVVAIVVEAVLRIGRRALKRRVHLALAVAAFVAIYGLGIAFPLIVLAAGAIGLAGAQLHPEIFAAGPEGAAAPDAPPAPRTRWLRIVAAGLAAWTVPLAALAAWRGWDSLHVDLYRFFTQAALVTFGGAYAVLAYVTQAAVGGNGWITSAQAVDGLALAETTPGPLIMVLQFVGFMSGWNQPEGMDRTGSAVIAALVTTWVTFLPSFLFIFLGAPYIEVLRGNRALNGALTGVTAAVVGVILNLAMVFGAAVFLPDGREGPIDWFAVVLAAAAFVALHRLKLNVVWVVIGGGLVGLGWTLLVSG